MKIIWVILFLLLICCDAGLAYQIVSTDNSCYVFESGKIKEDPNRYKVTYEVDEANKTITVMEEVDLRTGKIYSNKMVYQIVPKAAFEAKENLKGYHINPLRASIETISFCDGKYVYSKTQEDYINLYYGSYEAINK